MEQNQYTSGQSGMDALRQARMKRQSQQQDRPAPEPQWNERMEQARQQRELAEQERRAQEQAEKERLAREQAEQERLAKERAETARQEAAQAKAARETPAPAEPAKAAEPAAPVEPPKAAEPPKPAVPEKPAQAPKPAAPEKPVQVPRPAAPEKPAQAPKPAAPRFSKPKPQDAPASQTAAPRQPAKPPVSKAPAAPQPAKVQPAQKKEKAPVNIWLIVAIAAIAVCIVLASLLLLRPAQKPSGEMAAPEHSLQEDAKKPTSQTEPQAETQTQPVSISMPYCVGMRVAEATACFEDVFCTIRFEHEYSNEFAEDIVMSQDRPIGDTVASGDTVTLLVSMGPVPCPYEYSQKLTVGASSGSSYADMTLYEWRNGDWEAIFSCDATVGRNGIGTNYGEGKKITPQGVFKLGVALSANSIPNEEWPYYQVTKSTCVVDDVNSRLYNTIQNKNDLPGSVSYDSIGRKLTNGTNNVLIYIEHNGDGFTSDGVVAGKCSVITICGCSSSIKPTFGCVDISTSNMTKLLELLDYRQNPHIELTVW